LLEGGDSAPVAAGSDIATVALSDIVAVWDVSVCSEDISPGADVSG
jgi:hypothetical protein